MDELNSEKVLKLIEKMDEKERDLLLNNFRMVDIINILSNKENKDFCIKAYRDYAEAIENISNLYSGKSAKTNAEKLYETYISLDEESRKEASVLLYNNQEFQSFLTQILIGIVKQNLPQMLTFFKLFGIDLEKYMLDALRIGKGYKEYIIE